MFCRWCGSEAPDNAVICPHCGEVLKYEEEIVPERERIALEKEITKELFVFFSQKVGSAFSKDALLNRLEEIITDRKAREYSSQHLQNLLYKMVQKGSITSSLYNNETHYHILDTYQEFGFIDVLKKEEKSPLESPTIDSSSEPDIKLYLEGGAETVLLHQYKSKKIYLIVEKLSSSPIYDVEVHLSDLPRVDSLIRSRKIHATEKKNRIFFVLLVLEPGFFTLTATLTSKAGHRIALPIKIQVEPTKERKEAQKKKKEREHAIAASVIIGLIGGILFIVGLAMLFVFGFYGSNFSIGITLMIIGFIICFLFIGIATNGKCLCVCECCSH